MGIVAILILALIQGAAELLPVSSSAHVIVAGRYLGAWTGSPWMEHVSSPEFTFLLAMLHTGTMGAVIIFFYSRWKTLLDGPTPQRTAFIANVLIATAITGAIGLGLKWFIEKVALSGSPNAQIEDIFDNQKLIAGSLCAAGVLILFSAWYTAGKNNAMPLSYFGSFITGFVQGLCLPFRGFSRSGATISTGLILGFSRQLAEEFSFALAVLITPAVIARELWRLVKAHASASSLLPVLAPGLGGMVLSFLSGWIALKLLSNWIDKGRWSYFGYYCLAFAAVVFALNHFGAAAQ